MNKFFSPQPSEHPVLTKTSRPSPAKDSETPVADSTVNEIENSEIKIENASKRKIEKVCLIVVIIVF